MEKKKKSIFLDFPLEEKEKNLIKKLIAYAELRGFFFLKCLMIQASCKGVGVDAISFQKATKQLSQAQHLVLIFPGWNILIFQLPKLRCFNFFCP